jgi:hypothetical protein
MARDGGRVTSEELDRELARLAKLEREWIEEAVADGRMPPSALKRLERPPYVPHG